MNDRLSGNPYACNVRDLAQAPFAGRQTAFNRLRRQITDPAHSGALLILGRRRIGKTAFLRAFDSAFDETFVGIYLPLREMPLHSERDWWLELAQTITETLVARAFTLHRLIDMQPPGDDARVWFAETFLPPVLALIRPHRRVILLADNADALLDAVRVGMLASDTIAFLSQVIDAQPRLHAVLTLDTAHEGRLSELSPLVRPTDLVRLTTLLPEDSAWLLSEPPRSAYSLDQTALDAAYRLTGGEPAFLQALGCALYRRYETDPMQTRMTADDIKRVSEQVFQQVEGDLGRAWDALSAQEQQTLRAISRLIYQDPLRPLETAALGDWLADSDEPLDLTAMNATLRSLEYREWLRLAPNGVTLASDLILRWLMERTFAATPPVRRTHAAEAIAPRLARRNRGLRLALLVVLLAMFLVGLLLLSALSNLPRDTFLIPEEPTVTLLGDS